MARKPKERIKQWRVETLPNLPAGVQLPEGFTPAYFRKRHGLATLRGADNKTYLVFQVSSGKTIPVKTSRDASHVMAEIARGNMSFSDIAA